MAIITARTSIAELLEGHDERATVLVNYRLPGAGSELEEQLRAWLSVETIEDAARKYKLDDLRLTALLSDLNRYIADVEGITDEIETDRRLRLLAFVRQDGASPYPVAKGKKYALNSGNAEWYRQNVKCQYACPVHTDVPGYISLIAEGKYDEAYELNRKANIFPAVLGRVCAHPCETACRACDVDEAIAICWLKRSASDHRKDKSPKKRTPWRKEKVAVIGSGPCGLAAANDLALMGYQVTVFESAPVPGGMLWLGIPEWRLPRDILDAEVDNIRALGVEVRLNSPIGEQFDIKIDDLRKEYDSVFIAAGTQKASILSIPGEDLERVAYGITFMRQVNLERGTNMGKRVAVVGGGYTAMDCSRSALRMGAERVYIIYRRTQAEIPVDALERHHTESEGVEFIYLTSPVKILDDGKGGVGGMLCLRNQLGEPDANGRRSPVPIPGSEFTLDVDTICAAVSQEPELTWLPKDAGFKYSRGRMTINKDGMTDVPGVFAAGEFTIGPSHVIEVTSLGRKGAVAIDAYLSGRKTVKERTQLTLIPRIESPKEYAAKPPRTMSTWTASTMSRRLLWGDNYDRTPRQDMPAIPITSRVDLVHEVDTGYPKDQAFREADRCYQCQLNIMIDGERCILCNGCVDICPENCIEMTTLDKVANVNGRIDLVEMVTQSYGGPRKGAAMIIDEDVCIRCGLCVARCPVNCISMEHFRTVVEDVVVGKPIRELVNSGD